jgi:hypothetical protein
MTQVTWIYLGLLNAPATVAEEKKIATRNPVSERLYQLQNEIRDDILNERMVIEIMILPRDVVHNPRVQSGFCQAQQQAERCRGDTG